MATNVTNPATRSDPPTKMYTTLGAQDSTNKQLMVKNKPVDLSPSTRDLPAVEPLDERAPS